MTGLRSPGFLLFLALLLASAASLTAQTKTLSGDDPRVLRARQVLDRLFLVSEEKEARLLIEETDEPRSPRALPDHSIVLPSSLFDLCYGPDHRRWAGKKWLAGDHCLAFVLAHELFHIADGDSEQRRLAPDAASRRSVRQVNEDEADLEGLLLMWTAGFNPFDLFDPRVRDEEFFARYSRFIGATPHGEEASDLQRRGENLRRRIEEVGDLVPTFHWGTRLLQLGHYEGAWALLGKFEGVEGGVGFASREVLSNRGLATYQLLARRLAECEGQLVNLFTLPVQIDPETLANRRVTRGGEKGDHCFKIPEAAALHRDAERLLDEAIEQDPTYLPARLNLVSLHLLWRQLPWEALARVEAARALIDIESDPLWINASALAHYLPLTNGSSVDPEALRRDVLDPLRRGIEAFPDARYLAQNERQIRLEQRLPPDPLPADPVLVRVGSSPAPYWRIRPGRRAPGGKFEHRALTSRHLAGSGSAHWLSKSSRKPTHQALVWDDRIVIAEKWVLGRPPASQWLAEHGSPRKTIPLVGGELRIHDGWAYQVEDGAVVAQLWFDLELMPAANSTP